MARHGMARGSTVGTVRKCLAKLTCTMVSYLHGTNMEVVYKKKALGITCPAESNVRP